MTDIKQLFREVQLYGLPLRDRIDLLHFLPIETHQLPPLP